MRAALLALLSGYVAVQVFKCVLDYLNLRSARRGNHQVPPQLEGVVDGALLGRMQRYLVEKTRFDMAVTAFSGLVVLLFLFCGLLDAYNSRIASMGLPFVTSGWLFFLILYLVWALLTVPFTLYSIFRIENRYGFNTMTVRLWLVDFLKGTMLSLVLLSLAVLAGLLLVQWSPRLWWFWVWCFFLVFTVFITYIAPSVIEPLFNTFTPLEEGPLKERIVSLAASAGITVGKVLKMDESKRSSHTNAYFTGLGRTKRIILFDTLLVSMTADQILAVLAHEMGHWKGRHLLKGLALAETGSLLFLFCGFQALGSHLLDGLFAIHVDTFFAKAVIAAFFAGICSFLLRPLVNGFTRRLETEADRFACDVEGRGETMIEVLVQLSKDNLSNLWPHPLYVLFNYSHPPVLRRISSIREYCGTKARRVGGV
jgi:STE24 endopeptidase